MLLAVRRLKLILQENLSTSRFTLDEETSAIFADPVVEAAILDMRRRGWMNWSNFRDWEGDREELTDVPIGWWVVHWYSDPSCTVTDGGVWAIGEVTDSWIEIGEMTLKVKFLSYVRSTGLDDEYEVRRTYIKEIHNWWMVPDAVIQGPAVTDAMADLLHKQNEVDWRPNEHLPEDDYGY